MKKNVTNLIIIMYFLIFFLPFGLAVIEEYDINVNPNDYAKITDLEYKAIVEDSPGSMGKINVTEKITFDIHSASKSNPFWELWRDLPEDNVDGVDVYYKVKSVKQILDNGSEVVYEEAPKVYYDDSDYTDSRYGLGPNKWFYSPGPYSESRQQYEAVMIYIDGIYREKMTFEIEYEMYNASLRYGDCSELYLSMFSDNSVYGLKHFKGEILFPDNLMPKSSNYTVSTFGTNAGTFPVEKSTTKYTGYTTFSMDLDESDLKFRPYNEYIEFDLVSFGEDKHSFTKYASINDYYYDDVLDEIREENQYYKDAPQRYYKTKIIVFGSCLLISIWIINKSRTKTRKLKGNYAFYESTIPTGYYRDIPSNLDPLFAAHLAFCKDKPDKDIKDGYAALLLSLARKKYIELEKVNSDSDWTPQNTKIVIKYKPIQPIFEQTTQDFIATESDIPVSPETYIESENYEELTPNEKEYFNLISNYCTSDEITLSHLQSKISIDYDKTDSFVKSLENSKTNIGINDGYYQKANYTEVRDKLKIYKTGSIVYAIIFGIVINLISYRTRLDLAFGGYTIIAIACLLNAIYYRKQEKDSLLLTQFGEDECSKWRGLYEFLNSETLMNERTIIELPIWEQYLVYATAFGISEKVIKAIKIRCPEAINSPILNNNSVYHSHHFYHSNRSIRTYSYRASSFSGSHGGFGGYGGGGRGGGGGGGGH